MKKLILILTAAIFAVSCSDNLEDLNENIKDPANVSGESLFASAQKQLADQVVTPNVNLNNLRLWTQQLQETTYLDESRYNQITRTIPDNHWQALYRDVLKDLDQASKNIEATTYLTDELNGRKPNKQAIIEVLTVYAYSNLVETFGDVPYTEALNIENLLPQYDDGLTVYKDLLVRLTDAINQMDTSLNSFEATEDLIYNGDVSKWRAFANSLKLRMGIILSDVEPSLSQSTVESAFSSGVFQSNADNASYQYRNAAPNNNPMNNNLVLSGRNDYVAAKTIVDLMNNLEDPRRSAYFTMVDGEYIGGEIGTSSPYINFSHVADRIVDPSEPGVIMSYVEIEFLLAEAAERGYSVGADAATHYNNAITASFEYWNIPDVASYLAKPEVDYPTAIAASTSNPKWKMVIGTQAYLGLYNRTFAPYLSVRRLDYPILTEPLRAVSGFPVRYTYPVVEQTLNGANYEAASSAIGGDAPETMLFWDLVENNWGF